MKRRRAARKPSMRYHGVLRRIGATLVAVALAGTTLVALLLAGTLRAATDPLVPSSGSPAPGNSPHESATPLSPGRIRVAVVLGQSGTDAADALAPYEVFARSPQFSVYTVAEDLSPVQLNGGLSILPALTFAQLSSGRAPSPDLIVVPAVNDPGGAIEAPLRNWLRARAADGAQVLAVCAGARVLAASGLLDGHQATSHWSRISELKQSRPAVDWVSGQRYVQDHGITTTAGVTSGIPGALRLVQQLAGDAQAERIGRDMHYPGWSLDAATTIPVQHFAPSDLGVGLNTVLPWFRPTIGVALEDGIGEVDAVAPFEVGSYSSAVTVVPIGAKGTITTAHGVVIQTHSPSTAPKILDRLLVPGDGSTGRGMAVVQNWAQSSGIPVTALRTAAGNGGFDAALTDLAAHSGQTVADTTAKFIDYPAGRLDGPQLWWEPRPAALLVCALAVATAAGLAPALIRRHLRTKSSGVPRARHFAANGRKAAR